MAEDTKLFSDVKFVLARCNDPDDIKLVLLDGGAKHINYLSEHVTHVIADTNCPEAEEAIELFDKPVVNPLWVHLSVKAKQKLPVEAFSPTRNIFKDVRVAFSRSLTKNDVDVLAATVTYHGGSLSNDPTVATHFIVASASSGDIPAKSKQKLYVVAPDWVMDSVKQSHKCDEVMYDPGLLLSPPPPTPPPSAKLEQPKESFSDKKTEEPSKRPSVPESNDVQHKIENSTHFNTLSSQQMFMQKTSCSRQNPPMYQQSHQTNMQLPQIQQPKIVTNAIRSSQPRFRSIIPPNSSMYAVTGIRHQHQLPQQNNLASRSLVQNVREVRSQFGNINHQLPKGSKMSNVPLQSNLPVSNQEINLELIRSKVPIVKEEISYIAHDPKENVPKDLPFLGCKFKLINYDDVSMRVKQKWFDAIIEAGGDLVETIQDATHLICEDRLSPCFAQAIKMKVRCVTIYWINDVLGRNHLSIPWRALHLPLPFRKQDNPLRDQIISTSNFKGNDRRMVKEMLQKTGAKITDYFSQTNTLLICGYAGGDKYERSIEWKITVCNCQFLNDFLLTGTRDIQSMLIQSRYQIFNRENPLNITSYSTVREIMDPWLVPIAIPKTPRPEKPLTLTNGLEPPVKSISNDDDKTDKEISPFKRIPRSTDAPIRLIFTHLEPSLVSKLKSYALKLGLEFASSYLDCTHLVVDSICRTPKFICAFNYAHYILSYHWITESLEAEQILDEKQFIIQDPVGEEKFSFNLIYSLLKRKRRNGLLFKNIIFFVTPNALASVRNLKDMIESAGGIITTKKLPNKTQLEQIKQSGKSFVVVTNHKDLHLCSFVEPLGVEIVGIEFVISGILRQDIDFESHRISDNISSRKRHTNGEDRPETKKLRLE